LKEWEQIKAEIKFEVGGIKKIIVTLCKTGYYDEKFVVLKL
jgi:hypothetical protein